jgi:hypothetical protein
MVAIIISEINQNVFSNARFDALFEEIYSSL